MTPRQKKRLWIIITIVIGTGLSVVTGLKAFQNSITYFLDPATIAKGHYDIKSQYRVGGLVKTGSVKRLQDGITVTFKVTDCEFDVPVVFTGILPDLFREGQGIVANGRFNQQGLFTAKQVLAKHDENYVPTELAEQMLEQQQQCEPKVKQ